jgi:amidase
MTRTVADNALMLEVLAGDDGYDPRIKAPRVHAYTEALTGKATGLRIGLLKEGFEDPHADPAVNSKVRAASRLFKELGAVVEDVSVPMHHDAGSIYMPIITEGCTTTMFLGDGYGASRNDLYSVSLMDFHRSWRNRADDLPPTAKFVLLLGQHILDNYGTRYYGKAMNIVRRLRAAYDAVLERYDLLLMPTTPVTARPFPRQDADMAEYLLRGLEMIGITAPFDLTHHPAISIPCGLDDGLPVGLMLVGRHFEEQTIYRAAHAFEQSVDWKRL